MNEFEDHVVKRKLSFLFINHKIFYIFDKLYFCELAQLIKVDP